MPKRTREPDDHSTPTHGSDDSRVTENIPHEDEEEDEVEDDGDEDDEQEEQDEEDVVMDKVSLVSGVGD